MNEKSIAFLVFEILGENGNYKESETKMSKKVLNHFNISPELSEKVWKDRLDKKIERDDVLEEFRNSDQKNKQELLAALFEISESGHIKKYKRGNTLELLLEIVDPSPPNDIISRELQTKFAVATVCMYDISKEGMDTFYMMLEAETYDRKEIQELIDNNNEFDIDDGIEKFKTLDPHNQTLVIQTICVICSIDAVELNYPEGHILGRLVPHMNS
ncbi:hypothetical protein [Leptospira sp. 'Mane']|uniref:hypothetical protein n=1 Tax=Leptospira sp. 'Mane' TaxID=3387407 RepID=UPI00398A8887